jgi:hypothetical protein
MCDKVVTAWIARNKSRYSMTDELNAEDPERRPYSSDGPQSDARLPP